MTRWGLALVLLVAAPTQANELWSKLWLTADQRGEVLMQEGDASSAAKVYADPRRSAYAKLKAGDYAGAAKDLENLPDADSAYNRGNALAHRGNLKGALDAYDEALKLDPENKDARHNRELVAKALEQQPPQEKGDGDKSGEQQEGEDGKEDADQKGDPSGKDSGQPDQGKEGAEDQKAGNDAAKKDQEGKQEQSGADDTAQGASADAKDEAEQARRDAEAALENKEKPTAGEDKGDKDAGKKEGVAATPPPERKSEQQISQEQWLRSIPEDSAGLLRRKFMIEHLLMKRNDEEPN